MDEPWDPSLMWMGPRPPNLFYLHIRLLTRLFFNPYTVHSDVGGTTYVKVIKKHFLFASNDLIAPLADVLSDGIACINILHTQLNGL